MKYFEYFKIFSDLLRCPGKSCDRGVSRGFHTDGNVFSFYHSEIALGGMELRANYKIFFLKLIAGIVNI